MNPAIVVSAYNRPEALARLLTSLQQAAYPAGARPPLVISIDRGNDERNRQVRELAEQFEWGRGPKEVIYHADHLGLLQHVFFCGGLTEKYGAVIFLEDDLLVSPVYYYYASPALQYYDGDERIGGVSLYALWFNGYTHQPFVPLTDDADVFFLQIPYTQGQAWTRSQWQRFTAWRARGDLRPQPSDDLHEMWLGFDDEDHFPIMTKYLVSTGQFYVFPRAAHATGFGDAGVHFSSTSAYFQAPLQREKMDYRLKPLADSVCVYDSFFEILPDRLNRLTDALRGVDYAVDLYATKARRNLRAEYVLTSRLAHGAVKSFGRVMWPMEANVIGGVPGGEIVLCRTGDLRRDGWAELATRKRSHDYFTRHRRMGRRLRLQFALLDWIQAVQRMLRRGASSR